MIKWSTKEFREERVYFESLPKKRYSSVEYGGMGIGI